jgi:hypothetical protein
MILTTVTTTDIIIMEVLMMFTRETALAVSTVYYVELPDGINGITTPDPEHGPVCG